MDSCAARASFRVSSREESLFSRAGRKVLLRGGVGARFISVEDREWRLLGGAMWCGVMVEFSG